jgi:hypothetical protein
MIAATRTSVIAYELNGFGLQLEAAAANALAARQYQGSEQSVALPQSLTHVIRKTCRNSRTSPKPNTSGSSFEKLFKTVEMRQSATLETIDI